MSIESSMKPHDRQDVVISGLSGALASSADIYQFKENLYNKRDMVCGVFEQWQDHPYIPKATGMIPFIEKFDRGYFADSLFENQSERTFETALTPKAACTSNLDECSRKLCPNLRYFVVFSSFSGGRGANGQTNYGMANSVVDRICERRRRDGYPAVSVQWGSVEDVGMSAKIQDSVQSEWVHGVIPQRVSSCLNVLDRFLCQKEAVVASTLVSEKVYGNKATNLFDVVLDIMGIKSLKSISMRWTLSELGADSMVLVEVKQYLDRKHGVFMNSKELMHTTLERLKTLSDHDELRLAE
ncbi:hypothetical protein Trydic_g23231 [Trypoxylus dichotomus]